MLVQIAGVELSARFDPTGVERADIPGERGGLHAQVSHRLHWVAERRILLATVLRLLVALPQPLPHARPDSADGRQVDLTKAQARRQGVVIEHLVLVQHPGKRQDLGTRRHVEQYRTVQLLRPQAAIEADEVGGSGLGAQAQQAGEQGESDTHDERSPRMHGAHYSAAPADVP